MQEHDDLISLRLPHRLASAISAEAKASFRSRSEVIRDTLSTAFPPFKGYDARAAKVDLGRRINKRLARVFAPKRESGHDFP